ncbi:MAG TPA: thiopeptide-type bacteriocin biosynthesis protein [Candidatus Polarisedimenticolaceae bacterium]|nr:thiopeptide-type bacteriocin biosynthesis protein [Candidatus Polarisedimenticolaceae bacterium]
MSELYGPDERCLYTLMHAPRENHERLLHELVIPVVRELRGRPELDSLFFARYNQPDWQLRFRVLGRPEWVDGTVRPLVEPRLAPLRAQGWIEAWEFGSYQRELERYGGPEGMKLCERLFLEDTLACLDLLEAERCGAVHRSRREYSLVYVERFLDLLEFDRTQRILFYRHGYSWAVDGEVRDWGTDELRLLEERYRSLKDGLLELLRGGGEEAETAIVRDCLDACRPWVLELRRLHADGALTQELVPLAWSVTHMHANRLGLDPTAEAILRFFLHRLHTDEALVG